MKELCNIWKGTLNKTELPINSEVSNITPMLKLPEQREVVKYGRLHLEYLKAHRKGYLTTLLVDGTLNQLLCQRKDLTDEQKKIFLKFHDCWNKYVTLSLNSLPQWGNGERVSGG